MRGIVVVSLAVSLAAAAGALGSGSENSSTYRDTASEDPAAPDITTVKVSNDDAGVITFRINVPNRPTLTDDMRVYVNVDADSDATTGVGGRDYWLLVDPLSYGDDDVHPFYCANSVCGLYPPDRPDPSGALSHVYASGPTITVDGSYFGETKRFRFQVQVIDGVALVPGVGFDLTNSHRDLAPNAGWWRYDVKIGPDRLLVKNFSTTPTPPRAGRTFTVRLSATRSDTGAAITDGRVNCAAKAGAKNVRPRSEAFVRSQAVCVFAIPAETQGKRLRGTISIVAEGKKLARPFSATIR